MSPTEGWAGLPTWPLVMGVLNATPDSFSDGGDHLDSGRAVEAGLAMLRDGAHLLDVGGESTRPGAAPVSPEEEQARILPIVRALAMAGAVVSVDTRNASTMLAALDCGATVINDVSGLRHDPRATAVVARRGCPVILMHMRGTPETMGAHARYADVAAEVAAELRDAAERAERAGVARHRIALDPGIGFAKDTGHNVALLHDLPRVAALGYPLVVGVSRKRFVGALGGVDDPRGRDPGSLAAGLFAASQGARVLRVHNVAFTVQGLRVWQALAGNGRMG